MDDSVERPKPLRFKEPVVDVAFNPKTSLVASSLITGHVFVHRYAVEGNERLLRQRTHRKSCRSVCFSGDGSLLYSASKDKSWAAVDVETGEETMRVNGAHGNPLNLIHYVNEQIMATGDEAGSVKLWDVRKSKPAFVYSEHVDYISDMVFNEAKRHLLTTSGDGCLSVYDVRKAKPFQVSANQDDELLSIALMRNGSKVVVGETAGVLGIFSYGQFGDVSDRFPGHPQSIDTICKLTEDLCVTGSSDGLLRIVQLFPHRLVGVAGDHQALPVEKIVLSHDQEWLASCSHDHSVHFWDIGYIFHDGSDASNDGEPDANDAADSNCDSFNVQEMAIRISKEIGEDNATDPEDDEDDDADIDIDIDGYSDVSELKRRDGESLVEASSAAIGAAGGSSDSDGGSEVDIDGDDGNSGAEEARKDEDEHEDEESKDNIDIQATTTSVVIKPSAPSAEDKDVAHSDSDGWGSSDDDADSDAAGATKPKKRKLSKREKQKAKRKARMAVAAPLESVRGNPNKSKKTKSFFSGL
ncbi:WD domain repeat-containing protein 55 [Coemansia sp. RSA 1200]|nr:WD domain repeat-containing protein 55 [Coemansia sp. RSA 1200]